MSGFDILFCPGVKSYDLIDISRCLTASEVTEFAHRVVVILGVRFEQQALGDVSVPHLGVVAQFACECDGIVYVGQSGVVGREHKFDALGIVGHEF